MCQGLKLCPPIPQCDNFHHEGRRHFFLVAGEILVSPERVITRSRKGSNPPIDWGSRYGNNRNKDKDECYARQILFITNRIPYHGHMECAV